MFRKLISASILIVHAVSTTAYTQSDEPYNYSVMWRTWDAIARKAYVQGIVDGTASTYFTASQEWLGSAKMLAKPESSKVRKVRERVFLRGVVAQIPPVVSDLYSDPANAYVALIDMIYIGRDKLEGKDVQAGLAAARKRALDNHRLNQSSVK